ncbi:uncharacterized protein VTP21DRAFT_8359 [Calcarisporiella thermophila]|uniref:uncharacterized protein n=1 Tax=Calcarisporiella thermophila TaxID=911321 RepID=UPI003741F848
MSSSPLTQFAYRTPNEIGLYYGCPSFRPVDTFEKVTGAVRSVRYSKNGLYVAWALPEGVKIMNAESGKVLAEIARSNVVEIEFSPKGTYISTWERPSKAEDGSAVHNLIIWEVATGNKLADFSQKLQNNWNVQWTDDESYCARMVTNEVHFFDPKSIAKGPHSKLRLENISAFSLSPGRSPSVATFVPEKKGAPAMVRVYSITNFSGPLCQKTFFKSDKVQILWNQLGTDLLILTQTEVDKTGKSYYGETNLYFISVPRQYDARVTLDKEGPIHDVAWSPTSKEFVVVYGYMPAKATLFDHRANPIHDFGAAPRNYIRFSPHGRLICLAGFGNLAGTIDVWDRKDFKKISTIEASGTTTCEWSPDGRYLLTATLSPRLRVDNGFKVWHHSGKLVAAENFAELYEVVWRPASVDLFPIRTSLSPPPAAVLKNAPELTAAKPAPKKMGAYRPPHARGTSTPTIFKREDEIANSRGSTIPGAAANDEAEKLSKSAMKNKKRREARKENENNTLAKSSAADAVSSNQPAGGVSETDKKIRNINKKLQQIQDLKTRQANGEKLELTQIQKIQNEAKLLEELQQLKLDS